MFDRRPTSDIIVSRIDGPSEGAPPVHHRLSKDLVGLLRKLRDDESDDRRIAVLRRIQQIYEKSADSGSPEVSTGSLIVTNAVLSARLELDARVTSVAMSPDGKLMAVLSRRDAPEVRLELYSIDDSLLGKPPVRIDTSKIAGTGQTVTFSPDGRTLGISRSESVSIVPIEARNGQLRLGSARKIEMEPGFEIKSLSFDRAGTGLAVSAACAQYLHPREGEWQLAAFDIATGKRTASLSFDRAVPAVGFSADGKSLLYSIKETETYDVERGRIGRFFGLKTMRVERSCSKIKALGLERAGARPVDVVVEEDLPDFTAFAAGADGKTLRTISGSTISTYSLDGSTDGLARRERRMAIPDRQIDGAASCLAAGRACVVFRSYDYKRIRDDYWGGEVSEFLGGRQGQMILDLDGADRCSASIIDRTLRDAVERRAVSMSGDGKRLCIATPHSEDSSSTAVLLFEI